MRLVGRIIVSGTYVFDVWLLKSHAASVDWRNFPLIWEITSPWGFLVRKWFEYCSRIRQRRNLRLWFCFAITFTDSRFNEKLMKKYRHFRFNYVRTRYSTVRMKTSLGVVSMFQSRWKLELRTQLSFFSKLEPTIDLVIFYEYTRDDKILELSRYFLLIFRLVVSFVGHERRVLEEKKFLACEWI